MKIILYDDRVEIISNLKDAPDDFLILMNMFLTAFVERIGNRKIKFEVVDERTKKESLK